MAKALKTLLLNLPYGSRLVRRYMCSYQSPNILFPPLELLALGGIVREKKSGDLLCFDAVAQRLDLSATAARVREFEPDLIVTLTGFGSFPEDADSIRAVRKACPDGTLAVIGHYPTVFPREILEHLPVDCVIRGEPDTAFSEVYDRVAARESLDGITGIAYRARDGTITVCGEPERLTDIGSLPRPAYEALDLRPYSEPFLPRPYAGLQTARGCPYGCRFCVRSYGTPMAAQSPQRILEDVRFLYEKLGIRGLRFTDDTFTAVPERTMQTCRLLIESGMRIRWSCLSRCDRLNDDMLGLMKKAGCRSVYLGIESGCQRILDYYGKGITVEQARAAVRACRRHGIITVGFFVIGAPDETRDEFEQTLDFLSTSGLDVFSGDVLVVYPGTALHEKLKDEVEFSLFPYRNRFRDEDLEERQYRWKKESYRRFYCRPGYLPEKAALWAKHPREAFAGFSRLLGFFGRRKPEHKGAEAL